MSTTLAPGRYCLKVCYCRTCPHYVPFVLTGWEWSRLLAYLERPPSYRSGTSKQNPSYRADPLGRV